LQKPTSQLLAAMKAHLYELYTTYIILNIFATLNNLNLKMHECNHIIVFYSNINVFIVTLKL